MFANNFWDTNKVSAYIGKGRARLVLLGRMRPMRMGQNWDRCILDQVQTCASRQPSPCIWVKTEPSASGTNAFARLQA